MLYENLKETQAADKFCDNLNKLLANSEYHAKTGINLCYRADIIQYKNNHPIFENQTGKKDKYQTDICIYTGDIQNIYTPLIVIEIKLHTFTTHDIITYSKKAIEHKSLHPSLKYGLAILDATEKSVANRFFMHNEGFDFAMLIKTEDDIKLFYNNIILKLLNPLSINNQNIKGFYKDLSFIFCNK